MIYGYIRVSTVEQNLENQKKAIAERFTVDEWVDEKRSGTIDYSKRSLGLGLALCRSIVRAHGCEIMLDDNIPHGCVFSFTLPMKEVTLHE